MKRVKIAFISFFLIFTFFIKTIFAIDYNPSLYTFLIVSGPNSSPYVYTTSINNDGEIVGYTSEYDKIISSDRGVIVESPPAPPDLSGPSINDLGEVVYNTSNGCYSTIRGFIGSHGCSSINNLGEIVYTAHQNNENVLISTTRGILDSATPPNAPTWPSINDSGEVVYTKEDSEGNKQIFSTVRGQLTTTGAHRGVINNLGDVVYVRSNGDAPLSVLGGPLYWNITDYPVYASGLDINDYGDIIYYTNSFYDYYLSKGLEPGTPIDRNDQIDVRTSYHVLATQTPEKYQQYQEFVHVDRIIGSSTNVTKMSANLGVSDYGGPDLFIVGSVTHSYLREYEFLEIIGSGSTGPCQVVIEWNVDQSDLIKTNVAQSIMGPQPPVCTGWNRFTMNFENAESMRWKIDSNGCDIELAGIPGGYLYGICEHPWFPQNYGILKPGNFFYVAGTVTDPSMRSNDWHLDHTFTLVPASKCVDLPTFAKAFGSLVSTPNYNNRSDYYGDGDIDGRDLSILLSDFNRTDCPGYNLIFYDLFDNFNDSWLIEGNEQLDLFDGKLHMVDDNDSEYIRYIHPGTGPFQDDIPDIYTWSARMKFAANGAVENTISGDTLISTFIYNGKGVVAVSFSKTDGICLYNGYNSKECIQGSGSLIEEDVWHNWYMIVDSTNDPTWSIDIFRDNTLIASNLNVYEDRNTNDGRFGIENRGLSTDPAETYWEWIRIVGGAHPPVN